MKLTENWYNVTLSFAVRAKDEQEAAYRIALYTSDLVYRKLQELLTEPEVQVLSQEITAIDIMEEKQ